MSKVKHTFEIDYTDPGWGEAMDKHFEIVQQQDASAKKNKSLVGRYIQQSCGDGHAYYVIIRENKRTVRIHVVTGIGDDWILPAWGTEISVKKDLAISSIGHRDVWAAVEAKH